jgi:hypothetical protein
MSMTYYYVVTRPSTCWPALAVAACCESTARDRYLWFLATMPKVACAPQDLDLERRPYGSLPAYMLERLLDEDTFAGVPMLCQCSAAGAQPAEPGRPPRDEAAAPARRRIRVQRGRAAMNRRRAPICD